jgi:uncharacterized cofD-like protein
LRFAKPRILSIGGGTGLSTLLRGLKNGPAALSVIVTVTDDGGSSGRLREDLGVMPPGDIRNCMIALSEDENLMSQLFRFRFEGKGELHNHSFGNLFLSAMAGVTRDFAEAVRLTSEVLAIKGVIYPATNSDVTLQAEFADGSAIEGETRITAARKKIRRISLNPPGAQPLDGALDAIAKADLITIGPGSLYTSLIPNLLVEKIVDAVDRALAKKIYIQNIMTQPGESEDLTAADHVEALVCHSGGKKLFSRILLNNAVPSAAMLRKYENEGARLVKNDKERLLAMGLDCVESDLLAKGRVIRHDPYKLARALYATLGV